MRAGYICIIVAQPTSGEIVKPLKPAPNWQNVLEDLQDDLSALSPNAPERTELADKIAKLENAISIRAALSVGTTEGIGLSQLTKRRRSRENENDA